MQRSGHFAQDSTVGSMPDAARADFVIVELATLADKARVAVGELLAEWHIAEFQQLYDPARWNLESARSEFAAMTTPGALPTTWLACAVPPDAGGIIDITAVLGSVSLIASDDLPGFEGVGPWLASLYIRPDSRSDGFGARLTNHLLEAALAMGFDDVYLFTEGQAEYYLARGWRTYGQAASNGHPVTVMVRRTSPTAARRAVASAWSTDPDTGGAYSYLRVGATPAARALLAGSVLPGLWLAGEHTSVAYPATMHGAWFSGERAADQVIEHGASSALVIGAGLAGLAAARQLHDHGVHVVMLESGDRVGGRAAVDDSLGVPLPLGGAWLHGDVGHPLRDLVTYETSEWDSPTTWVAGHGRAEPEMVAAAERLRDEILDSLPSSPESQSVNDVAGRALIASGLPAATTAIAGHLIRMYLESLYAAPMNDASAREVLEHYWLPGGDHFVTSDLRPVFIHLAEGIDLRFGHAVRAIRRVDSRWFSDSGMDAEAVIVTIPVGALRNDRIAFNPPLPPSVRTAIDQIGAGPVCKLFTTYDTRWWAATCGTEPIFTVRLGDPLPTMATVDISSLTGVPTLMWFAVGEHAVAIEQMDENARCRLADDIAERCGLR